MPTNATLRTTLQQLEPEHLQLVALRLQRLSWTKCAANLGVDRSTVYRWREEFPEIERLVREECEDHLALARERLPEAVASAVHRMQLIVDSPASEDKDAVAAAKLLIETVAKPAGSSVAGARDGAERERDGPASVTARARVSANVIDVEAELESELAAR